MAAKEPTRAERRAAEKAKAKGTYVSPEQRRNKLVVYAGVAALLVGGIVVLAATDDGPKECPGHWHSTFGIFIDGERVAIPQPPYTMGNGGPSGSMGMALHMHAPDQEQFHFEPAAPRCVGVESAMRTIDIELDADKIQLDGAHEQGPFGGTHAETGNQTIRYFVQASGDPMREMTFKEIRGYQLADLERMLIAYGEYPEAAYEAMMEDISWPPGASASHPGGQ